MVGIVLLVALAIDVAILIVPAQEVHLLGQTLHVGAVRPAFDLSGPGHVVLFNQSLDVMPDVDLPGLIRPMASLTDLSSDAYLGRRIDGHHSNAVEVAARVATHALVVGWLRYFVQVAMVAGLIAGVLGLVAHRGIARHRLSRSVR